MKNQPPSLRIISLISLMSIVILSSCYSVRISNTKGVGQPDPLNNAEGFYRGLEVHVIDTVVNLSLLDNEVMVLNQCPEGCFHSVEYRVTLGDVLRSGFTFGKKRKIRVKYVCLKESND